MLLGWPLIFYLSVATGYPGEYEREKMTHLKKYSCFHAETV